MGEIANFEQDTAQKKLSKQFTRKKNLALHKDFRTLVSQILVTSAK